MPISGMTAAYGLVVVGAITLFAAGTPVERSANLQARLAAEKPVVPAYSVALGKALAVYAKATGPNAPAATMQVAGVQLRSVGFDFPSSDRTFPDGPGVELITNNCQSCHSPGMILSQPPLTKAEWNGEVTKMLHTYKAPVSENDVAAIVTYLASLKPPP